MKIRYPRPGEIWKFVRADELWLIIENGKRRGERRMMRLGNACYTTYSFDMTRLNFLWERVA